MALHFTFTCSVAFIWYKVVVSNDSLWRWHALSGCHGDSTPYHLIRAALTVVQVRWCHYGLADISGKSSVKTFQQLVNMQSWKDDLRALLWGQDHSSCGARLAPEGPLGWTEIQLDLFLQSDLKSHSQMHCKPSMWVAFPDLNTLSLTSSIGYDWTEKC